jgi:hypothetical protein
MRPTPCARRVHRGPSPGPVDASPSQEDDGGANGIRTSSLPCGANRKRIGTAKLGSRDKPAQLPAIGPEPVVSGPDSAVPLSQDPAKARRFLGCSLVAGAKSLQPQTGWRGADKCEPVSGREIPVEQGRYREFSRIPDHRGVRGPENGPFPAIFGGISLGPGTGRLCSRIRGAFSCDQRRLGKSRGRPSSSAPHPLSDSSRYTARGWGVHRHVQIGHHARDRALPRGPARAHRGIRHPRRYRLRGRGERRRGEDRPGARPAALVRSPARLRPEDRNRQHRASPRSAATFGRIGSRRLTSRFLAGSPLVAKLHHNVDPGATGRDWGWRAPTAPSSRRARAPGAPCRVRYLRASLKTGPARLPSEPRLSLQAGPVFVSKLPT